MSTEPTRRYQDRTVSLPASLVLSVVTLLVGAGGGATIDSLTGSDALTKQLEDVADKVDAINARLAGVERSVERIEEKSQDRWTRTDMRLWIADLRRRNPTWDVPEVGGR